MAVRKHSLSTKDVGTKSKSVNGSAERSRDKFEQWLRV